MKPHPPCKIAPLALYGVFSGADNWTQIEQFGNAKQTWFGRFPDLRNGIRSIVGRVFVTLDPARTYLNTSAGEAETLGKAVRCHFASEDQPHWELDLTSRDDEHRVRTEHAAHNFAVFRRLALLRLKQCQH